MSSLLVPVSVAAKIVKTKTAVPNLTGQPFNTEASLEPGVHVHWALPDALTRAKTLGGGTKQQSVLFPGVPDLWLVTRFNPATAASPARAFKAWVVDSRAKTVTTLDKWVAPSPVNAAFVHTLPGVLPSGSSVGFPGWGLWDGSQTDFDAAITAAIYYPSGRTRFGLYDDLSDLPGGGNISYTVVGWFSASANDPLYNSSNREKQIQDWLLSYNHHRSLVDLIPLLSPKPVATSWNAKVTVTAAATTITPILTRINPVNELVTARSANVNVIQAALGKVTPVEAVSFRNINPVEIVCHGSVMNVPSGSTPAPQAGIATSQVTVHPSIKRALAAATASATDPNTVDYAEMLLQDLDHQRGTMAGILDLPGATQALSFQSVPGAGNYFGQIKIAPTTRARLSDFTLVSTNEGIASTGHWPVFAREAHFTDIATSQTTNIGTATPAGLAQPAPKFAQADIDAFITKVHDAFKAAIANASAVGTPIDPNLIKVSDTRHNAQPLRLSPSISGSGTDSAGWWVSINDVDALTQIFESSSGTTAVVSLPDTAPLYNQPGPRWYRPWSPQIVLNDVGRSYRFGEDGRFDPVNGTMQCRTSGYTTVAIYAGDGKPVSGSQLIAHAERIVANKALHPDCIALLNEAVVLDIGSVSSLAAVSTSPQPYFQAAIQGLYLRRLTNPNQAQSDALNKIRVLGETPGPVAISPYLSDPWDPLFLDSTYTYTDSPLATNWRLAEDHVEMTPESGTLVPGKSDIFHDRSRITATITKVLSSALVTRRALDPQGNFVVRQAAPNQLTEDVFQTKETISAPLVHTLLLNQPGSAYGAFDDALLARGFRQRAGSLAVNQLSLVDVFGTTKQWTAPAANNPATTPLTPRLPFWGRVSFRLQSAGDVETEADSGHSSICGILLPDFLDHSLQIYDGSGNALGQLTCDRARFGEGPNSVATTLNVRFTAYPWVLIAKNVSASDPTMVIDNLTVRSLVLGLLQQSVSIPAAANGGWFETGLTAMMRCIDSVRATIDPAAKSSDRKVSLLGEPILVMVGRVKVQSNTATDTTLVAKGTPLAASPAIPAISVRIGDITRPDDGVFGFFKPNDSPVNSRFAPVSKDAAAKAMINALSLGFAFSGGPTGVAVTHPFVENQINEVMVPADGPPMDVIMLTDIRGSLYATAGVLPRKKITVPKDFLDASLMNMEPVFSVGPIMIVPAKDPGSIKALMPPPLVQGYDATFIPASANAEVTLPPLAPAGDMAPQRVQLTDGWVKMHRHKS